MERMVRSGFDYCKHSYRIGLLGKRERERGMEKIDLSNEGKE